LSRGGNWSCCGCRSSGRSGFPCCGRRSSNWSSNGGGSRNWSSGRSGFPCCGRRSSNWSSNGGGSRSRNWSLGSSGFPCCGNRRRGNRSRCHRRLRLSFRYSGVFRCTSRCRRILLIFFLRSCRIIMNLIHFIDILIRAIHVLAPMWQCHAQSNLNSNLIKTIRQIN
jgi:hypothetical protein